MTAAGAILIVALSLVGAAARHEDRALQRAVDAIAVAVDAGRVGHIVGVGDLALTPVALQPVEVDKTLGAPRRIHVASRRLTVGGRTHWAQRQAARLAGIAAGATVGGVGAQVDLTAVAMVCVTIGESRVAGIMTLAAGDVANRRLVGRARALIVAGAARRQLNVWRRDVLGVCTIRRVLARHVGRITLLHHIRGACIRVHLDASVWPILPAT